MHPYLFELASLMAIFAFAIVSPGADLADSAAFLAGADLRG